METKSTQQEVLLMTGTQFLSGQLQKTDEGDDGDRLSARERLEEACWNGMLREMLPEICDGKTGNMYLWRIREGNAFLELELGDAPVAPDGQTSIDPYVFLPFQLFS